MKKLVLISLIGLALYGCQTPKYFHTPGYVDLTGDTQTALVKVEGGYMVSILVKLPDGVINLDQVEPSGEAIPKDRQIEIWKGVHDLLNVQFDGSSVPEIYTFDRTDKRPDGLADILGGRVFIRKDIFNKSRYGDVWPYVILGHEYGHFVLQKKGIKVTPKSKWVHHCYMATNQFEIALINWLHDRYRFKLKDWNQTYFSIVRKNNIDRYMCQAQ